jgi:type I restriction enzyme S subunit
MNANGEWKTIALGELMPERGESVDPANHPDEVFNLYSIPAFDSRKPEVLRGAEIGSTKQLVEADDVMISKIVPHIRRAWVVGESRGHRTIASSEWIVFRDARIFPGYMRHLLVENRFHAKFMSTVSGVGGSLLRARPAHVAKIEIPLPPLAEQRRIAEVLDRAEALRAKRRAALAELDSLTQSLFLDLFGDPEGKSKRFSAGVLGEFCSFLSGFAWKAERFSKDKVGLPIIRIQNVDALRDSDFIYWPDDYQERFVIRKGDLLLTLSGSFRMAEWTGSDALLNQRIVRIDTKPGVERLWLLHAIRLLVAKIEALGRHALVNNVALSDLRNLLLVRPPLAQQREFARRVTAVEALKAAQRASLAELDALFASLQHRAFRGEL